MHPFLDLKFIKLPLYGISIASGVVLGGILVILCCHRKKKDVNDFLIIAAMSTLLAFAGAKLLYLMTIVPFSKLPKALFLTLFKPKEFEAGAGFVFYGGLIGGFIGYFVGTKIAKCSLDNFFEEITFLIPLVHGFGRLGCFFGGCCYGISPYNGPLALHYNPETTITSVPTDCGVFPVQPLESILLWGFAAVMLVRYFRNKSVLLPVYLVYYAVVRFFLEFLRGDLERGHAGLLSTSQWISIGILLAGILLMVFWKKILVWCSTASKKQEAKEAVTE